MFGSFFYTIMEYINWIFPFNQTQGAVWYIEERNDTLAPILDQVLIDVEPQIDENKIRNDFQDLLYQDDLFPQLEKFSTPKKEFARYSAENDDIIPVHELTPLLDVTEVGVEPTPGHVFDTFSRYDSMNFDHKPRSKFWAYLYLAYVLLIIIVTLYLLIRKYI